MEEYQNVSVQALKESPLNPRRTFDKKAIEELEKSIRETGKVLTPLLVRPNGTGSTYEVLAGARRLRCAVKIGLETVPVRVLENLSDAQALEIMVIENLQRADVHPLEEAQAYSILMKSQEIDVAAIAKKVGMSQEYVYGRLKLLDLIVPVRKAFEKGAISAGHAILLARLDEAEQTEMFEFIQNEEEYASCSVKDLEREIKFLRHRKKYEAEAKARRDKEAAERKSSKGKSAAQQQAELNRKYEEKRAAEAIKRKADAKVRVETVRAILAKVTWPLPRKVLEILASHYGSLEGFEKRPIANRTDDELARLIINRVCGNYSSEYFYAPDEVTIGNLAKLYKVRAAKPVIAKPEKTVKKKPRSKKKKLQTSAKPKRVIADVLKKKAVA